MVKTNEFFHHHLHYITVNFIRSVHICTFTRMGVIKMNSNKIDSRYYINVASIMNQKLPRPKHRSRFIVNYGELLPIIGVDVGRCQ